MQIRDSAKMSGNKERYRAFIEAYKKAYTDITPQKLYDKAQGEWNAVKNDLNLYNEIMTKLKLKCAKQKTAMISWWAKPEPNQSKDLIETSTTADVVFNTEKIEQTTTGSSDACTSSSSASAIDVKAPSTSVPKYQTPAQDKINDELNCINTKIVSLMNLKTTLGLNKENNDMLQKLITERVREKNKKENIYRSEPTKIQTKTSQSCVRLTN